MRGCKPRRAVPTFATVWLGFHKEASELARFLRPYSLDLLHTNNTGCEESPLAARRAGIPRIVGTFHVDPTVDVRRARNGPTYRVLECVSNRCLDRGIAVSEKTAELWRHRTRLAPNRVITIHNGIDPDRFSRRSPSADARRQLGLPPDAGPVVGAIGRLDDVKGLQYLLDAVAKVRREYPSVYLVLAGDGPQRAALEATARSLGIASQVAFLGFQSDVQPVLDALDVFVIPSLAETLGYSLLEAMATGLPAIGTSVGGIPEAIADGETGILVAPRDSSALAGAMRRLLENPCLRAEMGAAAHLRVTQCFRERRMTDRTIAVYRELLQHHGRR